MSRCQVLDPTRRSGQPSRTGAGLVLLLALAALSAPWGPCPARAQEAPSVRNPERAVRQYLRVLEKSPEDADTWYNLGYAYILLENWDEAVKAASRAAELRPESALAQFRAGEARLKAGRAKESLPYFRRAVELDSELLPAHVNHGQAALDAGEYQEAIDAFRQALRSRPENPSGLHAALGEAHLGLGNTDEAVRWFERTIEAAPDSPTTHHNLGVVYRRAGRTQPEMMVRAAAAFGRAADLAPRDPMAQFLAGETHFLAGQLEPARVYLERYAAADPDGRGAGDQVRELAGAYLADLRRTAR